MRGISQNCTFELEMDEPSSAHPRGGRLIRRVRKHLLRAGYEAARPDNWRDCGWDVECVLDSTPLQIVLAVRLLDPERTWADSPHWFIQIGPTRKAGLLSQLFARGPHPAVATCLRLAVEVDGALRSLGAENLRWRWDRHPEESDPEHPVPLD